MPQSAPPSQAPARPQFEQHGRQTQGPAAAPARPDFDSGWPDAGRPDAGRPEAGRPAPGGPEPAQSEFGRSDDGRFEQSAAPAPRQRTTWQEQLQPMVASPESRDEFAVSNAPAPANIAIVPASPRSKLRLATYIAIPLVIIALGVYALYYTSRPVSNPPTLHSCMKQNGATAVKVVCSTPGAYEVVQSVTDASKCPDYLNEPSIAYTVSGKTTIYCLQEPSK
jgi:hypothetical protein